MQNFEYQTPTRLIFGEGALEKMPEVMAPLGKKVLLAYGGGSIKKNGIYDKVMTKLEGCEVVELSGIQPNPKYDPSVLDGVRLCKENGIEVIVAVGGGSVLDCAKAVAACACYDGEAWDIITRKVAPQAALPIVAVTTIAASGSEYDGGAVISRTETNDKRGFKSQLVFPVAAFLDPTFTYSVPKRQTVAACADAMNHTMERYFVADSTMLNDGFCEANLRSIMANTKAILENPEDYRARAEFMQSCTYGCNGILELGNSNSGKPCHCLEHALSAYYDINHGEGLAIITPKWMKHILNDRTLDRFVQYGVNVFGIDQNLAPYDIANCAIEKTAQFFASIGLPSHLKEVGIDESRIHEMAKHIVDTEPVAQAYVPLDEEDIVAIFTASL